ncbi:MAG: GtrA family protein [Pseudomonadota bacterium]
MRYTAASAAALVLDFALTFTLRGFTSLSLTASAAVSFIIIAVVFYFVHEFWTFRREDKGVSGKRLSQNLLVVGLAFAARIGIIAGLEALHPSGYLFGMIYFCIGVVGSFSINFLVNRYWVFRE